MERPRGQPDSLEVETEDECSRNGRARRSHLAPVIPAGIRVAAGTSLHGIVHHYSGIFGLEQV